MSFSAVQRAEAAYAAGFRNTASVEALSIIVAISLAECGIGSSSGCETGFCCGGAAGVWQIQLDAHPDISLACATELYCCARAAWAISGGGSNFHPWTVYCYRYPTFVGCGNGTFRDFLDEARAAVAALGATPTPPPGTGPPDPAPPPAGTGGGIAALALLLGGGGLLWVHRRRGGRLPGSSGGFGAGRPAAVAAAPATPRPRGFGG